MIHPTAIIDPRAEIHPDVEIGPYVVIDGDVQLGAGCVLGPHVYLTGHTVIGPGNRFHANCVIGDAPQDLKYKGQLTGVRIGANNAFRECVTVHRSAFEGEETVVGSNNLLMACAHVGHNSRVGNGVVIANGALLGGHACVEDKAFISGTALIHQFTRVGSLAIMQGGSAISKDVPPFTIATGKNQISGLNVIGLRRAGYSAAERIEIKRLYRLLFRSGLRWVEALEQARTEFSCNAARQMLDFVSASKRGVCADAASHRKSVYETEQDA